MIRVLDLNATDFWREVEAFRAYNRSKDLSHKTITLYDHALQQFHRWLIKTHGEDAQLTARNVREYMAYRLDKGNSRRTVRIYVGALRTFCSFLVMDGIISEDENPLRLIKTPKVPTPQIVPLTNKEIHRLLDSFNQDSRAQRRDYLICCLILDTGLRIGEVARLKLDDVDFEKSCLSVNGKGKKPRTTYIGRKMKEMLLDYMENHRPSIANGNGVLFPPTGRAHHHHLQVEHLSAIIREKMDQAGIPRCQSSGHRLRHTFAVNFIRNGGNMAALQRLLGHASLTMTRRYVMLAEEDLAEAHQRASPLDRMAI